MWTEWSLGSSVITKKLTLRMEGRQRPPLSTEALLSSNMQTFLRGKVTAELKVSTFIFLFFIETIKPLQHRTLINCNLAHLDHCITEPEELDLTRSDS